MLWCLENRISEIIDINTDPIKRISCIVFSHVDAGVAQQGSNYEKVMIISTEISLHRVRRDIHSKSYILFRIDKSPIIQIEK